MGRVLGHSQVSVSTIRRKSVRGLPKRSASKAPCCEGTRQPSWGLAVLRRGLAMVCPVRKVAIRWNLARCSGVPAASLHRLWAARWERSYWLPEASWQVATRESHDGPRGIQEADPRDCDGLAPPVAPDSLADLEPVGLGKGCSRSPSLEDFSTGRSVS